MRRAASASSAAAVSEREEARAELRAVPSFRPFVGALEVAGRRAAPAEGAPILDSVALAVFFLLDALLLAVVRARAAGTLEALRDRLVRLGGELAGGDRCDVCQEGAALVRPEVEAVPGMLGLVRFPRETRIELRGATRVERDDAGPFVSRVAHVQQALRDLGRRAAAFCAEHVPTTDTGRAQGVVLKAYRDHLAALGSYPTNVGPDGLQVAAADMVLRRPSRALARLKMAAAERGAVSA